MNSLNIFSTPSLYHNYPPLISVIVVCTGLSCGFLKLRITNDLNEGWKYQRHCSMIQTHHFNILCHVLIDLIISQFIILIFQDTVCHYFKTLCHYFNLTSYCFDLTTCYYIMLLFWFNVATSRLFRAILLRHYFDLISCHFRILHQYFELSHYFKILCHLMSLFPLNILLLFQLITTLRQKWCILIKFYNYVDLSCYFNVLCKLFQIISLFSNIMPWFLDIILVFQDTLCQ